jgi:hypothetical protein
MGRRKSDDLDGLVSFLLDRLIEDEVVALAAIDSGDVMELRATEHVAAHVARHDPDRVLRDAAAKRMVVRMWLDGAKVRKAGLPAGGGSVVPEAVLAQLAAAYSDHPEFDVDWLAPGLTANQFGSSTDRS